MATVDTAKTQQDAALEPGFQRFEEDTQYVSDHEAEFREHYPERWVAIWHQELCAVNDDLDAVLAQVADAHIPVGEVVIGFMSSTDLPLL
jgi:hypothetical protein